MREQEEVFDKTALHIWKASFCSCFCGHLMHEDGCIGQRCPVANMTVEKARKTKLRDLLRITKEEITFKKVNLIRDSRNMRYL